MIIKQYETIKYFNENIYTSNINIDEAEMDQSNLSKYLVRFNDECRAKTK